MNQWGNQPPQQHFHQPPPNYGQQPGPPKKSGPGCLVIAIGIVATFGMLGGLVCVGLVAASYETPQQHAAREDAEAQHAAAVASVEAARLAEHEARYRKECRLSAKQPVFPVYDSDLRDRCRDEVRMALKVPGSGRFEDLEPGIVTYDGCARVIESVVIAKNAFGVEVRDRYKCSYDPRTGGYSVAFP